jgi:hypothetical protein
MTSLIPRIPEQDIEDGRLLIQAGRSWLTLTEEDIERGARAVARDCTYRNEIARCALRYAEEIRNPDLLYALRDARDRLNSKPCPCGRNRTTQNNYNMYVGSMPAPQPWVRPVETAGEQDDV